MYIRYEEKPVENSIWLTILVQEQRSEVCCPLRADFL